MYSTLQACRAYLFAVGRQLDTLGAGHVRQVRKDCAGVILYTAENATWMAGEAIQILGGNGYTTNIRSAACGAMRSSMKSARARARSAAC